MADRSRSRIVNTLSSVINKDNVKPGVNSDEIEKSLLSDGILTEPVNKTDDIIDKINDIIDESPYNIMDDTAGSPLGGSMRSGAAGTGSSGVGGSASGVSAAGTGGAANAIDYNPSEYLGTVPDVNLDGLDDELINRTREHENRSVVDKFIKRVDVGDIDMENERLNEEKLNLLHEIEILKSAIDDGESLESVPTVDHESPYAQVLMVAKMLHIKNKRLRYTSFAEEMIMFGVYLLEDLFNGERVWFNKYKPDLTGWNRSVQVKLRRLRPSLSRGVTSVVDGLGLGLGMELAAELLPSAFMYSRSRQKTHDGDDADYNAAFSRMRK